MKVRRKTSPTVNGCFPDFSSVVLRNDWDQPLVVELATLHFESVVALFIG
jgi:hypothetical protein